MCALDCDLKGIYIHIYIYYIVERSTPFKLFEQTWSRWTQMFDWNVSSGCTGCTGAPCVESTGVPNRLALQFSPSAHSTFRGFSDTFVCFGNPMSKDFMFSAVFGETPLWCFHVVFCKCFLLVEYVCIIMYICMYVFLYIHICCIWE